MLASSSKRGCSCDAPSQKCEGGASPPVLGKGDSRGEGAAITSGDEGVAATFQREPYFPFMRWLVRFSCAFESGSPLMMAAIGVFAFMVLRLCGPCRKGIRQHLPAMLTRHHLRFV